LGFVAETIAAEEQRFVAVSAHFAIWSCWEVASEEEQHFVLFAYFALWLNSSVCGVAQEASA
jgi:hypothetical protein